MNISSELDTDNAGWLAAPLGSWKLEFGMRNVSGSDSGAKLHVNLESISVFRLGDDRAHQYDGHVTLDSDHCAFALCGATTLTSATSERRSHMKHHLFSPA